MTGVQTCALPISIATGAISTNWYPSGSTFGGLPATVTDISTATGTLYFVPFYLTTSTIFTQIGTLIGATAAGNTVLGIYNDSGNSKPTGSPITNSNSTSISNSANTLSSYTFSGAITLSAGVYWLAFSVSATNSIYGTTGGGYEIGGRGLGYSATPSTATLPAPQAGWSQTFTYSATLPSVGSLTAVAAYAAGDSFVYLQAQ